MSNTAGNFLSDGKQMIKVKSFGEALRLIIADSGKQYHEISNSVGCTKGDLKDWENDKGFPNANQLQRLFSIFRRLRHFAQQFKADEWATAEADGRVTALEEIAANAAATVATTAVAAAAASIGDIGDLEIAAIEYARAMRAHSVASMKTIALKKEYDAACAESERLSKLVDTLDASFRSKANRA
jgi:transcriptional regulator with XRE-family HTH domain